VRNSREEMSFYLKVLLQQTPGDIKEKHEIPDKVDNRDSETVTWCQLDTHLDIFRDKKLSGYS
jgi:hypothetical protein